MGGEGSGTADCFDYAGEHGWDGVLWEELDVRMLLGDGDDGGVDWTSVVTASVRSSTFGFLVTILALNFLFGESWLHWDLSGLL